MCAAAYAVLLAVLASAALALPTAHAQQAPDYLPFVTTWKTDAANQTVSIPLAGSDITVHWGDGHATTGVSATATHTYANPGTYEVSIHGGLKAVLLGGHPDAAKLASIDQWGDASWTSMRSAFAGSANMVYAAADAPDLSRVTDMSGMFEGAALFDGDISFWDVSSVTNMSAMFYGAASFNQTLDSWDVSSVEDMNQMFRGADRFNHPLDSWDVSSVATMFGMFLGAASFNHPLDSWDVSSVTDMSGMFYGATSFNHPLDSWDVSSVTNMEGMFALAPSFNHPLDSWDVSSVRYMNDMFANATSFNQNLGPWYITLDDLAVSNDERTVGVIAAQSQILASPGPTYGVAGAHADLFEVTDGASLRLKPDQSVAPGATYDVNVTATGPDLLGGSSHHRVVRVAAVEPTDPLLNAPAHAFVTTWAIHAPGQTVQFHVTGPGISIDWGDGHTTADVSGPTSHTYAEPGTYAVIIAGGLERFRLDDGPGSAYLSSIAQWGNSSWTSMASAFRGASHMDYGAADAPDLSRVTDMSGMFEGARLFNGDISSWDTSSVTDMSDMFSGAASFNQPLNSWDISSVWGMYDMFAGASSFNQPLNSWDVSSVTDMERMFEDASSFNHLLNSWDVSSVEHMDGMFAGAASFNHSLNSWDVSSVEDMSWMFAGAASFNHSLNSWDVSSVADMSYMFYGAASFNQPLDSWDILR